MKTGTVVLIVLGSILTIGAIGYALFATASAPTTTTGGTGLLGGLGIDVNGIVAGEQANAGAAVGVVGEVANGLLAQPGNILEDVFGFLGNATQDVGNALGNVAEAFFGIFTPKKK